MGSRRFERADPWRLCFGTELSNPFNPATTFSFDLPMKSFVSLDVIDLLGREVALILSEELLAGTYSQQWDAANLPSGVYFYRLQAGSFSQTRRLLLLR